MSALLKSKKCEPKQLYKNIAHLISDSKKIPLRSQLLCTSWLRVFSSLLVLFRMASSHVARGFCESRFRRYRKKIKKESLKRSILFVVFQPEPGSDYFV